MSVNPAGLLLTGGRSGRMGRDKATLPLAGTGQTLSEYLGALLSSVTSPTLEVGPGHSGLSAVPEQNPEGPLVAITLGAGQLSQGAGVIVLATDMPRVSRTLLEWLAGHPHDGSVVPVAAGHPQPLCARYSPADLEVAARAAAAGRRAMSEFLRDITPYLAGPDEWLPVAGDERAFSDVDTPADLERLA